jgi:two-component system alkaline phosphatase synthesis response regulator PhoP/two-component system response regulator VicR
MKKILVVDDERKIVQAIEEELKKNGFQVITAYDGQEGLEKVRSEKPDLVILDRIMPKLHGQIILNMMRQDDSLKSVPVIMLTADKTPEDIVQSMVEGGAVGYIVKPFEMKELIETVKKFL